VSLHANLGEFSFDPEKIDLSLTICDTGHQGAAHVYP
jgi:hypothetical protein